MIAFNDVGFTMSIEEDIDVLRVDKSRQSTYCYIEVETNKFSNGRITLRSMNMVKSLHFMLGLLLSEDK